MRPFQNTIDLSLITDEDIGLVSEENAILIWEASFQTRDWGISDLFVLIKNIVINYEIDKGPKIGFVRQNIDITKFKTKIIYPNKFKHGEFICPKHLTIDFTKMLITLEL